MDREWLTHHYAFVKKFQLEFSVNEILYGYFAYVWIKFRNAIHLCRVGKRIEGFVLSLNVFYYTVYYSKSCFDTGIIENTF